MRNIRWHLDSNSFGGVLSERVLASIPLDDTVSCGLCLYFRGTGAPSVEWWERIDDITRQGFAPISEAKARALCGGLVRFLEMLEGARV